MIADQKINKGFIGVFLMDGNIDGTKLALTTKPNAFRRFLIKLILGWKWIDINQLIKI